MDDKTIYNQQERYGQPRAYNPNPVPGRTMQPSLRPQTILIPVDAATEPVMPLPTPQPVVKPEPTLVEATTPLPTSLPQPQTTRKPIVAQPGQVIDMTLPVKPQLAAIPVTASGAKPVVIAAATPAKAQKSSKVPVLITVIVILLVLAAAAAVLVTTKPKTTFNATSKPTITTPAVSAPAATTIKQAADLFNLQDAQKLFGPTAASAKATPVSGTDNQNSGSSYTFTASNGDSIAVLVTVNAATDAKGTAVIQGILPNVKTTYPGGTAVAGLGDAAYFVTNPNNPALIMIKGNYAVDVTAIDAKTNVGSQLVATQVMQVIAGRI